MAETKEYLDAKKIFIDSCRDLAKEYGLKASQIFYEIPGIVSQTSEGPINFRDAEGRLVACIRFEATRQYWDEGPFVGIEKIILTLLEGRLELKKTRGLASDFVEYCGGLLETASVVEQQKIREEKENQEPAKEKPSNSSNDASGAKTEIKTESYLKREKPL